MFKIHQYEMPLMDEDTTLVLPVGHQKLRVGTQDGFSLLLWCLVDTEQDQNENAVYRVVGTGHKFPEAPGYLYFDTVVMPTTGLVWHLFWKI